MRFRGHSDWLALRAFERLRSIPLAAILAFASVADASGPGPRARLRYERVAGAESCPAQPAFEAEVAAWLGYDPFSDSSPRSVVIELSPSSGGVSAHLRLADRAGATLGEREMSTGSPDCRDLTQALVLAVALAVDPLPITRDVIGPGVAPPPPAAATSSTAPLPASHELPKRGGATITISLGGSLWVASSPEPAPGIIAGVDVRWGHLSIGLDGQANYPTNKAWTPGSIQVSLSIAEVVPCYRLGVFGVCAVAAVGAEFGRGENLVQAASQPLPYVGAGARLFADIPIGGPFSIRLQADGLTTLLGASYHVGASDAWDTPPVAFEAAATLALRL